MLQWTPLTTAATGVAGDVIIHSYNFAIVRHRARQARLLPRARV